MCNENEIIQQIARSRIFKLTKHFISGIIEPVPDNRMFLQIEDDRDDPKHFIITDTSGTQLEIDLWFIDENHAFLQRENMSININDHGVTEEGEDLGILLDDLEFNLDNFYQVVRNLLQPR